MCGGDGEIDGIEEIEAGEFKAFAQGTYAGI